MFVIFFLVYIFVSVISFSICFLDLLKLYKMFINKCIVVKVKKKKIIGLYLILVIVGMYFGIVFGV